MGEKAYPSSPPFLTLYTFDLGVSKHNYSYSQFCTKLRFRMRHAGVSYRDAQGNPEECPKGKFPYVQFADLEERMGDSALITRKLIDLGKVPDVNASLTSEKRALDLAIRALVEDRTYFLMLHERWKENYYSMRDKGPFTGPPSLLGDLMAWLFNVFVYVMISVSLWGQGTGRYTREESALFRGEVHDAFAALARVAYFKSDAANSEEPFWILGGEEPTEADFALFGYLIGVFALPQQPASRKEIEQHHALVSYLERIHWEYFAEYPYPFANSEEGNWIR